MFSYISPQFGQVLELLLVGPMRKGEDCSFRTIAVKKKIVTQKAIHNTR
jgi:hypothetical protein